MQYRVENIRVIRPSAKVAEAHPERVFTVKGTFYGEDGQKLSIQSKDVTTDMVKSADFDISIENGTLSLPEGRRGRKASAGLAQTEVETLLKQLRK